MGAANEESAAILEFQLAMLSDDALTGPAYAAVAEGKADRAILICTNGIGMAMTANRIPGVRAALIYNARTATMTRKHHDSNALCLGAGEFTADELIAWVLLWLDTEFEGGRHARRVGKFEALDEP